MLTSVVVMVMMPRSVLRLRVPHVPAEHDHAAVHPRRNHGGQQHGRAGVRGQGLGMPPKSSRRSKPSGQQIVAAVPLLTGTAGYFRATRKTCRRTTCLAAVARVGGLSFRRRPVDGLSAGGAKRTSASARSHLRFDTGWPLWPNGCGAPCGIGGAVTAVVLLVAYALSRVLQRQISRPILSSG